MYKIKKLFIFLMVIPLILGSFILENHYKIVGRLFSIINVGDFAEVRRDAAANWRSDWGTRQEVVCPQLTETMTVLLIGQSNMGNFAEVQKEAPKEAVVFYDGKCYVARDPLLGASGDRGSPWPDFASAIISSGRYRNIVLVPFAVGGSPAESWAPGGIFFDRIERRLGELRTRGLSVTHVLIGQGEYEADSRQDGQAYAKYTMALIEALRYRTDAKIYLATTGRCVKSTNHAIHEAQKTIRSTSGVLEGPTIDAIQPRINGCHFAATAEQKAGQEWAKSVLSK